MSRFTSDDPSEFDPDPLVFEGEESKCVSCGCVTLPRVNEVIHNDEPWCDDCAGGRREQRHNKGDT